MATETTMLGRIGKVRHFLGRLISNRAELQHVEPSLVRLEGLFAQMQEASDKQAFHTAGKQEASVQLQTFLGEAERLATVLQLAVKQHYGIRAEKLADFGLKPFRGRPRNKAAAAAKAVPEPAPKPAAPEPSHT